MKIISSVREDVRHLKGNPGGYEWWYFDAIDRSGRFKLVIIFYDGIPFSLDYFRACENAHPGRRAYADLHPGMSISLYDNDKAVFYDLCEYPSRDCSFSDREAAIRIGPNRLESIFENDVITYIIEIHDELPGGDRLEGTITFSGQVNNGLLPKFEDGNKFSDHTWDLVLPKARVSAEFHLASAIKGKQEIVFTGDGYHDHNLGENPLYNSFHEWYWARFHFKKYSLVVYAMNTDRQIYRAWLIDNKSSEVAYMLSNISIEDESSNFFALRTGRRIIIKGNGKHEPQIQVYLSKILDSGPFYMRFSADAVLHLSTAERIEKAMGIAEYIRPGRLKWKIFWPLVRMRFRVMGQKPHPVQKFPRLFRWTW